LSAEPGPHEDEEDAEWSSSTSEPGEDDDSDYIPSSTSGEETDCSESCKIELRRLTLKLMLDHPKLFLGVGKENISVIDSLAARLDCKDKEKARLLVMVVLRKVKMNETYKLLGLYFGFSAKTISLYFRTNVATIAACLQQLIFRPPRATITANLPQAFRYKYYLTDEIIDAFELEVNPPDDPKNQVATYSAYKHFNGLKVVVGITPDGYVSFVSDCFGGKVSDVEICKRSGYLDGLPKKSVIMADRGFKHLHNQLIFRNCTLVRPPSVQKDTPLSESQCMEAKQIASLRIHVERGIVRLREYAMISPHARLSHNLIPVADYAVKIAAGLTNLSNPLIRV
jgi:hypothetical protein